MPMQKYTSVKMNGVQGLCPTSGYYFRFVILVLGHSSFGNVINFFPLPVGPMEVERKIVLCVMYLGLKIPR